MDIFAQAAEKIIEKQEGVIGPLALEQAKKVSGLKIDWSKHEVLIEGDKKTILEHLVENYAHLFGRASVEVCREAVHDLLSKIPSDQLPVSLK